MLFTDKRNFGVTSNIFLNTNHIAYLNSCIVKTPLGYTIGSSTSIGSSKCLSLKKAYSEYLERFSLGININSYKEINAIQILSTEPTKERASFFGYGNSKYGHIDTTGTASGTDSNKIIKKAILEIIEKNDCLCFWYSNLGNPLSLIEFNNYIKKLGFISTKLYAYIISEISNYYSVIVIGIYKNRMICNGIASSGNAIIACKKALQEAKIIEWQQFNNSNSSIYNLSNEYNNHLLKKLNSFDNEKTIINAHSLPQFCLLNTASWITNLKLSLIGCDRNTGIKTVKCISNDLISCVPTIKNLRNCKNITIVKKYYKDLTVDCSIV